jgi:hypothetical protein
MCDDAEKSGPIWHIFVKNMLVGAYEKKNERDWPKEPQNERQQGGELPYA